MPIAGSNTVSKAILLSQSYANIYNLIDDKSNVPDPSGSDTRKMIYRRDPLVKGTSFKGYPCIIINPASITFENYGMDGSRANVGWEINIEILCSDTIRNNNAMGAEWCDELTESILYTLNDTTNRKTLRSYGMANIVPDIGDVNLIIISQERIFSRTITLKFNKRLEIG